MIYTSNFSKASRGKYKGLRVAIVDSLLPFTQGLYDVNMKELAPSRQLKNDFKYRGLSTDGYCEVYVNDILNSSSEWLDKLSVLVETHSDITLLCYCGGDDFCHRHILRTILEEYGFEIGREIR